ncbi:hypothetical protein AQUCO_01700619v1 [Aquilegia coerulea]|uniref:PGG domain-containing protein n=1 Tax=Aquilegia coerulea TaxID=218851 RepID=A0A2G5DNW8_AQUCA|nr:hypothetical protein AQUCO_01700619v1 [Aquilegia coerulea]
MDPNNPISCATKGDVEFFKQAALDVLLNARDGGGDTVLSTAVMSHHFDCCVVICERCPSLLFHLSSYEHSALHHAAWNGNPKIIKLLLTTAVNYEQERRGEETCSSMVRMLTNKRETALHKAALNNKIETVKMLLEADPDFVSGPCSTGETPLMYAMREALSHENARDYVKIRKLLLKMQPQQSKTRAGENEWTALHHATSIGDLGAIEDIIRFCPDCSELVDNKGQNFLHLAVKFEHVDVVNYILGTKKIATSVLNGLDSDGNTPLDIAAFMESEIMTLCLLSNPRVTKKIVNPHFHWAVKRHNFEIMKLLLEAESDFMKGVELDVLINSKDENGDSILSKAAKDNHLYMCEEIYERCPLLLFYQNKDGYTALHHAAWRGEPNIVKFLTSVGAKTDFENKEDIESGGGENNPNKKLLSMVDERGETALHRAVLNHKLEAVKLLIEADPKLEYYANNLGDTPYLIAMREALSHGNTSDSGKIRRLLLEMQPSQSQGRIWDNGWTSLHYATYKEDLSAVEDIIQLCSNCLELVDNEGQNFLHLAAKLERIQVVKHVLGARETKDKLLNAQDNYGNTPLHIAVLSGNESLAKCFLYDDRVNKKTTNKNGQRVLHAINFDYDKRKAGVHGVTDRVDQKDLKDQSDFDLVVGALIATVSFTAGITVPGGYISEGPNQGTAVLSKQLAFEAFVISNTLALLFSLYAVFSHFCTRRLLKDEDILYQLSVATFCTLGAIYAMMVAFIAGSFAVLADSSRLAIIVCVICCSFFIFACRPMWKLLKQQRPSGPK